MLYLGCPMWSLKSWQQSFFSPGANSSQYLSQYSSVFNTVEGNTTFYGLPSPDTVQRWKLDAAEGFRFCFKLPRVITHQQKLRHCSQELDKTLQRLAPLADKLGPFMIQLPAQFGPENLSLLNSFLRTLPKEFCWVIELRHREFFDGAGKQQAVNEILQQNKIGRVMLDSRALFSVNAETEAELDAQQKKPRLPVCPEQPGEIPVIRFIAGSERVNNPDFWQPWLKQLATWIDQGKTPYFFMHTPDNHLAPQLAREFNEALAGFTPGLTEMPAWPVEKSETGDQLGLF